jgi:hypothetical protein
MTGLLSSFLPIRMCQHTGIRPVVLFFSELKCELAPTLLRACEPSSMNGVSKYVSHGPIGKENSLACIAWHKEGHDWSCGLNILDVCKEENTHLVHMLACM